MKVFSNLKLILFIILLTASEFGAAQTKNRLEDLFLWKMSDELKLAPADEKKFSDLVKELNQKKSKATDLIDKTIDEMAATKDSKKHQELLLQLKKELKKYQQVSMDEIDQMQKILGPSKTVQYLVAKADLTVKIKSLVSTDKLNDSKSTKDETNKSDSKKLPDPKIIEE